MTPFEKLIELNGGNEPCTSEHFANCRLWIRERFGHKSSDIHILAVNLINIKNYGWKEIFWQKAKMC